MTTGPNTIIKLRTGFTAPAGAVKTILITLETLADGDMNGVIALYEARELARDPGHVLFPGTGDTLRGYHLIDQDGRMHDITRDIILAAVAGDGTDIRLVTPYAGTPA